MYVASRFIRLHSPPMAGPDVLEVQTFLAAHGFDPGPLDGVFGPSSCQALRQFQKQQGITADGIVTPDTWRILAKILDSDGPDPTAVYPKIHVHVDTRVLTMTSNGTITAYPVAVGKPSTPSPVGEWKIVYKSMNPGGPFGVRWMRLSVPWGGYGIHGTNNPKSIGKAVSHGCIRLYNEDVIKLYNLTPVGTPVSITGTVRKIRILKYGMRGQDVQETQQMLFDLGYYRLVPKGYFGRTTRQAVLAFQKKAGLKRSGRVGPKTLKALQIEHDLAMDDTAP